MPSFARLMHDTLMSMVSPSISSLIPKELLPPEVISCSVSLW